MDTEAQSLLIDRAGLAELLGVRNGRTALKIAAELGLKPLAIGGRRRWSRQAVADAIAIASTTTTGTPSHSRGQPSTAGCGAAIVPAGPAGGVPNGGAS